MKKLYTAHAKVTNGREGHAETDDKQISVNLSAPGGGKPGTNPEQLFACGYAACFGSAVAHVAKSQKLEPGEIEINSEVNLNQDDNGYFISALLNVSIEKLDTAAAEKIVKEAHQVCPYSKATRGNIDVQFNVTGKAAAKAA